MASIFSKIIAGEIPCHKVAESSDYFAFLDIRPVSKGHTLVVPKKEVDYVFDLDNHTYLGLMEFAKKIAKAMDQALKPIRVGMTVEGLEVPHAHVHLIPLQTMQDALFQKKMDLSKVQMEQTAKEIATYFIN